MKKSYPLLLLLIILHFATQLSCQDIELLVVPEYNLNGIYIKDSNSINMGTFEIRSLFEITLCSTNLSAFTVTPGLNLWCYGSNYKFLYFVNVDLENFKHDVIVPTSDVGFTKIIFQDNYAALFYNTSVATLEAKFFDFIQKTASCSFGPVEISPQMPVEKVVILDQSFYYLSLYQDILIFRYLICGKTSPTAESNFTGVAEIIDIFTFYSSTIGVLAYTDPIFGYSLAISFQSIDGQIAFGNESIEVGKIYRISDMSFFTYNIVGKFYEGQVISISEKMAFEVNQKFIICPETITPNITVVQGNYTIWINTSAQDAFVYDIANNSIIKVISPTHKMGLSNGSELVVTNAGYFILIPKEHRYIYNPIKFDYIYASGLYPLNIYALTIPPNNRSCGFSNFSANPISIVINQNNFTNCSLPADLNVIEVGIGIDMNPIIFFGINSFISALFLNGTYETYKLVAVYIYGTYQFSFDHASNQGGFIGADANYIFFSTFTFKDVTTYSQSSGGKYANYIGKLSYPGYLVILSIGDDVTRIAVWQVPQNTSITHLHYDLQGLNGLSTMPAVFLGQYPYTANAIVGFALMQDQNVNFMNLIDNQELVYQQDYPIINCYNTPFENGFVVESMINSFIILKNRYLVPLIDEY